LNPDTGRLTAARRTEWDREWRGGTEGRGSEGGREGRSLLIHATPSTKMAVALNPFTVVAVAAV